jgi:putative ATP-dependent endonuclease of OLD family
VLAKQHGYDLDELGVSVCSVSGTNFEPYLALLGPKGLNIPLVVFTDQDPREPKNDGTPRMPLGLNRVVNQMLVRLVNEETWNHNEFDDLLGMAPAHGIFMNSYTFEVDLFLAGLHDAFAEAMNALGTTDGERERMAEWAADPETLDAEFFLSDIESVGKGRFAQRLASIVVGSSLTECPEYILKGLKHVAKKCRRA